MNLPVTVVMHQLEIREVIRTSVTGSDIHVMLALCCGSGSAGKIKHAAGSIDHYALSSKNRTMAPGTARILAWLILQLKHPSDSNELIQGNQGVFHLLIHR